MTAYRLKNASGKVISVENLARAIRNGIPHADITPEDARAMAEHILNFFGYNERIIDNVLEPQDRDAFYILEDSGILTTEREETTLYDGREWRIHYWLFCKDMISKLSRSKKDTSKFRQKHRLEPQENVYEEMPDDIWNICS